MVSSPMDSFFFWARRTLLWPRAGFQLLGPAPVRLDVPPVNAFMVKAILHAYGIEEPQRPNEAVAAAAAMMWAALDPLEGEAVALYLLERVRPTSHIIRQLVRNPTWRILHPLLAASYRSYHGSTFALRVVRL